LRKPRLIRYLLLNERIFINKQMLAKIEKKIKTDNVR